MEKGESLPNYSPETHCAFCLHVLKGKKDRRRLSEQDGLVYISGQVVLIGPTKMIGAKFACQKCWGRNTAEVKKMERERVASQQSFPVRPVPSLNPRDPAVDDPDYILVSKSRFIDILDFMSKNRK